MNIKKVLELHKLWLGNNGGVRANFRNADLQGADFRDADLRRTNFRNADFRGADFRGADFRGAVLQGADFRDADFRGADFRGADLQRANFRGADLQRADFRGADFRGAVLDFSSGIPFSCGGTQIKIDNKLFAQMLYHLTRQNNEALSDVNKTFLASIPKDILNSFCNYRIDVVEI